MAKGMMIVSYDLPENVDEGFAKLSDIADLLRPHFKDEPGVVIHVAVRDDAESILAYLNGDRETEPKTDPEVDMDDVNSGYRRGPND